MYIILKYSLILVVCLVSAITCVDRGNFKTCDQSSFCRRNRGIQPGESSFHVIPNTVSFEPGSISLDVLNSKVNVSFKLTIDTLQKNTARIRMTELIPMRPRFFVDASLVQEPLRVRYEKLSDDKEGCKVKFNDHAVSVTYKPLKIDFYDPEGVLLISTNNRGLMNFEHYRNRDQTPHEGEVEAPEPPVLSDEDKGNEQLS